MKYDNLVIVESPAKAKTISKFLPNSYVMASVGHIRDLPSYTLGIKIEDGKYIPRYEVTRDHKDVVATILKEAKNTKVYLATDDDREGEAISYHIASIIGGNINSYDRIVFHEITKQAILNAMNNPRKINMDNVHAQEARRMLDRLVGFKLSPLLCKKVASKLSAGRVQSAALKIILDRDREIDKFVPIKYFNINTIFKTDIPGVLVTYKDTKIGKLTIDTDKYADEIVDSIKHDKFTIGDISSKTSRLKPQPPFKTTTLQQTASNQLGFDPKKTMNIAQKLYEGIDVGSERKGLITYMRTDSLNLADIAIRSIRDQIVKDHGSKYLPERPRIYHTTTKGAQEAHEAIRVTDITLTPSSISKYLDRDMEKLYTLIYNRTMMCQMSDSEVENQTVIVNGNESTLRIVGRKVLFDGWSKLNPNTKGDVILPVYKQGDTIVVQSVNKEEKATEPPARYNPASLVKTLEDLGIGRPSTYASIISLLKDRFYVRVDGKAMITTTRGIQVVEFLEKYFPYIVDSSFTAKMESSLDEVADGKLDMNKAMDKYITKLLKDVEDGNINIPTTKPEARPTGNKCPKCNADLVMRKGKYGDFEACSNYPKCKYITPRKIEIKEEDKIDSYCPECHKQLIKRIGRFGPYYSCSGYPECKFISKYPVAKEKCKCGNWQQEITKKDGTISYRCLKCNPIKPRNRRGK